MFAFFESKLTGDNISRVAIYLLFLIIPIVIMFLWGNEYNLSSQIDNGKFGTFGDFFGGVLGSIWSLCGVLLFYSALKEQRKDFETNSDALLKQVDALRLQSEEFTLQREELALSRNVFIEQSKTLMQQRLETTYFSLINLYNDIHKNLNSDCDYFKKFKDTLNEIEFDDVVEIDRYKLAQEKYVSVFYDKKEELSHYFKIVYRIIKIIDDSPIEELEKFRYVKILRSQLTENEMLALYYNSHSHYGGELYKFILKYNLLKHLPSISKIEFKNYLSIYSNSESNLNESSKLLRFNNEIFKILSGFEKKLSSEINSDSFEMLRESYEIIICDNIILELESFEMNELKIVFSSESEIEKILNFEIEEFIRYFTMYLYDVYVFTRYLSVDNTRNFVCSKSGNYYLEFELKLSKKLEILKDME